MDPYRLWTLVQFLWGIHILWHIGYGSPIEYGPPGPNYMGESIFYNRILTPGVHFHGVHIFYMTQVLFHKVRSSPKATMFLKQSQVYAHQSSYTS